jgi:hypothetical protein
MKTSPAFFTPLAEAIHSEIAQELGLCLQHWKMIFQGAVALVRTCPPPPGWGYAEWRAAGESEVAGAAWQAKMQYDGTRGCALVPFRAIIYI